jgi:ParB family chromosome partitioning protein
MNVTEQIVLIPLNKLVSSSLNVRKTNGETIDELAASIAAHGLLQNLVVSPAKGDKHQVIAGGRRFLALSHLARKKVISKTLDIPCRVVDGSGSTEASLAENAVREQMHPADEFDAFKKMIDEGSGVEEVAARFGLATTAVRQRLKLANVSPALMALYRAGEINLDQMMALAVRDDHAAQERVWSTAPKWRRDPEALRRALTEGMVDGSTDPRARFVGIEEYMRAGGLIERDLFQANHEGYLTDPVKLEELAAAKLESVAGTVRAEGWLWVEILPSDEYPDSRKYGRIYSVPAPLSPEAQAEIKQLEIEQDQIEEKYKDGEDFPQEVEDRLDEIESRLEELNERAREFSREEMKLAGAIVALGNNGQPTIHRGLVRPEDKKKLKEAAAGARSSNGHPEGDNSAGEDDKDGVSATLAEDLTAHKTAALRAALATRPDVALVAVTHKLALLVCYKSDTYDDRREVEDAGSALSLISEKGGCRLNNHAKGIETSPASLKLEEIHADWRSRIPAEPQELWQWLLEQEQSVVLDLLAFCAGQTVHAVRVNHGWHSDANLMAADHLAQAVGLDMADWWNVTGESYLRRVKREQILAAIQEATGETNLESLGKLKKSELVQAAEARLAGTRWLPEIFRQ